MDSPKKRSFFHDTLLSLSIYTIDPHESLIDVAAAQGVMQRGLILVADGQSVILPAEEGCLGTQ